MMKLEPIDGGGDLSVALRLLTQGFPGRSPEFWRAGLARARATSRLTGIPAGQLLISKGEPSGIVLTFGSKRAGRPEPVVNLSAWYVSEAKRFLAPMMLKAVTAGAETYTDLTPTPQAARLSQSVGFRSLSQMTAIVPLVAAAFVPSPSVQIVPFQTLDLPYDLAEMATAHEALGCYVAGIRVAGRSDIVMARPTRYFNLASAEVLYADRRTLRAATGSLSRHWLRQGIMTLSYDCESRSDAVPMSVFRRSSNPRLIKGQAFENRIDYAWSELALLNL
jgi:hypothetical protein